MKIPPNVVIGVTGALVALVTATLIAANWEQLTNLQRYEARFTERDEILPPRSGSLAPGGVRSEIYLVPHANVTRLSLDVTWQDPSGLTAQAPEVSLRLLDPAGRSRAAATHRGGLSGIHVTAVVIPADEIPTGTHAYDARGAEVAQAIFESRWPTRGETAGNWTVELAAKDGGAVTYSIHFTYDFYSGTWGRLDLTGVK